MAGLIPLVDARAKASAVLEAALISSDAIVVGPLDAIEPPCIRVGWADPWLEPEGQAAVWEARLEVLCIAARVEPGSGYEVLEQLVTIATAAFARADYPYPVAVVGAPRGYEVGGVPCLSAQIIVRTPTGTE